jgi:hypothetical protein
VVKIIDFYFRVGFIAVRSAAVALTIMMLTFAANVVALSAGPERIKSTLTDAIDDGTFLDKSAFDPLAIFSVRMGREINTYPVECFIWTTLLAEPSGGLLVKVLRTPRLDPDKGAPDSRGPPSPSCQAVLQFLAQTAPESARPQLFFYDRYIYGQRAIAQVLLEHFSLRASTVITKIADFCAFAFVLILAWLKRNTVIACIAALFLLFGGLSYFGGLLFFVPIDFAHVCVLLCAIYTPFGRTSPSRLVWIGALYGAVIAVFEGLSGGIPMALVLLALITGVTATDRRSFLQRFAILAFAFTVVVVTCFAIKLVTVAVAFDVGALARSQSALLFRLHGDTSSAASADVIQRLIEVAPEMVRRVAKLGIDVTTNPIAYFVINYAYWSFLIGWGSSVFGILLVVVGLTLLVVSTLYISRNREGDAGSPGLIGCWLAMGVVTAWVALFWNHTLVHPFFMARLLLVPVICGFVAACVAFRSLISRKALLRPSPTAPR